jgi:hypothetical protein
MADEEDDFDSLKEELHVGTRAHRSCDIPPLKEMVSPNQDPHEVPTPKYWCIIHTYIARIKSYYMNSWVTKEIHR